MDAAFLVGISSYPNDKIRGVSNDLALLAQALRHRNYPDAAIHVHDDTHTTGTELRALLAQIGAQFEGVDEGSCYLHVGASGALSLDPGDRVAANQAGPDGTGGKGHRFVVAHPFWRPVSVGRFGSADLGVVSERTALPPTLRPDRAGRYHPSGRTTSG